MTHDDPQSHTHFFADDINIATLATEIDQIAIISRRGIIKNNSSHISSEVSEHTLHAIQQLLRRIELHELRAPMREGIAPTPISPFSVSVGFES